MGCKVLGTTDAAMRLGCSAEYVRQLERAGKLPAEKMPNGRRVFKTEDVERLAVEREQRQKAKRTRASGQN
jgi:excisionase family DNA binding protein